MRRENLPDGGNDKLTWKRSRDLLTRRRNNVILRQGGYVPQRRYWAFIWDLQETSWRRTNRTSRIRTTETSWWRITETSLRVSFETCLRCQADVLMGSRFYVLLRNRHDVPIRCRGDVPLRRLGDVPPRRYWVFHLRRTCDVAKTYRGTSLRRRYDVLLPGWEIPTFHGIG